MSPVQFVSIDDFHRQKLLPSESLSVFAHELKRLMDQAMPDEDAATRKQLLIHQFLTGIPDKVSKQLRAAGEIDDLERIIQQAKLLMTLEQSEKTAAIGKQLTVQQNDAMEALKEQVAALTEQVAALATNKQTSRQLSRLLCFRCNQPGHMQRNCLNKFRQCFVCGRVGHIVSECRSGNDNGAPRMGWRRPNNSKPFMFTVFKQWNP